jgi:bacteriocin biosynthesis cyclodehydratase domain-containing protein
MPASIFRKPLLPSHYSVWFEPPDEAGDEVLHIVSERRSLKLKGHSFREFHQRVVPLLDGRHSVEEIEEQTADLFRAADLTEALNMLGEQGVVVEGSGAEMPGDLSSRLAPQLNFFREMAPNSRELQARLEGATVAIAGLGGAGAGVALALAAAGVGTLRCVDALPVALTDVYLAPLFSLADVGSGRAATVASKIKASAPQVAVTADFPAMVSENDLRRAIAGADFVICCLDAGQSNVVYKLNRVCLADNIRWISCSLAGSEIAVGPAIHPGESACYLCYRMRAVACGGNPEEAFAYEKYLDRRKRDDSGRRENLVFGAGLAANLLALEAFKELTGIAEPSLVGRVLTVELADLGIQRHTILRKPWCPACFEKAEA